MHSRTRTLLTGAALTLLAAVFAAGLGATRASAASTKTKIHTISACGATITRPGTYSLTKSITDSGSTCITISGNDVTLNLNGHTITGDGTDTCIYVEDGSSYQGVNDHVVGGAKKTMATLKSCKYGLYVFYAIGTTATNLTIDTPATDGVYEEDSAGMQLSNINVPLHSSSANGMYLVDGANNSVTHCTVDNNNTGSSFYLYYEVRSMVTHSVAEDTYNKAGNAGTGFYDEYSWRDTYSHDTSKGHDWGFYVDGAGYGPVTLTNNTATDLLSTNEGFYLYYSNLEQDSASKYHTLVSHNTSNGFKYGFEDVGPSSTGYPTAETWTNNTATNYSEYGFYIYYPTDYTFNGNVAEANTKTKKYDGSSTTYGFYLYDPESYYPFVSFSKNQSYDNEWGFYSDEDAVGGTGNIAKRNKYETYQVQIVG